MNNINATRNVLGDRGDRSTMVVIGTGYVVIIIGKVIAEDYIIIEIIVGRSSIDSND